MNDLNMLAARTSVAERLRQADRTRLAWEVRATSPAPSRGTVRELMRLKPRAPRAGAHGRQRRDAARPA